MLIYLMMSNSYVNVSRSLFLEMKNLKCSHYIDQNLVGLHNHSYSFLFTIILIPLKREKKVQILALDLIRLNTMCKLTLLTILIDCSFKRMNRGKNCKTSVVQ